MSRIGEASALVWLATEAGKALLAEAERLPPDRLTRLTHLRRHLEPEIAAVAVGLLELRRRARDKFTAADTMLFTAEGLEQSTGEHIAHYRASRFPPDVAILDACCGIGGDAQALARRGPVLAVDSNPAAAVCTRFNAGPGTGFRPRSVSQNPQNRVQEAELVPELALTPAPVTTLCADVTRLDLGRLRQRGIEAAFFDPSRRQDRQEGGRRRARDARDYSPPLDWLEALCAHFPAVAVKVSPALEDDVLCRYPARVEFLSDRRECKEAVLWFGSLAEGEPFGANTQNAAENYCATLLRPDEPPVTLTAFACARPPGGPPRAWLYEPDPAVIRAHLIPQTAALLNAAQMDAQIAYLTADTFVSTPFATAYRLLEAMPYNLKHLQKWLRGYGGRIVAIKKRGVPFTPEEVRTRLTDAGAAPVVLVLTRLAEKPYALLCAPPE